MCSTVHCYIFCSKIIALSDPEPLQIWSLIFVVQHHKLLYKLMAKVMGKREFWSDIS